MRQLYTFLILIGFAQISTAQQYPLFTNFITNRYGFNPAVNMDTAGICANLVFRKQWTGVDLAPQTMIAGARGRLKPFPIGAGGYFFTDQAGVLRRTGAYGMFNFVQTLSKDTRVSVGASIGFYSFRLDDGYVAPQESSFDQLIPSALDGKQFADFNAGIYLEHKGLYAGFSVPQVFEKKFDFTDLTDRSILLRHYYFMAGYRYKLNDRIWLEPTVLVKYFQTAPLQVDGGVKITFDKFWMGGTYRKNDAVTAMAGVNWDNFGLGYSFDVTTSKLRTVSDGTHEITLEMCIGKPKDTDKDGCPDKDDKCPDKPGPKENDCCPEERNEDVASSDGINADTDGDGIPDRQDRCPTIPGVPQNQGCPWGDRDGDGIRDDIDRCPDLPGVASNYGCPIDDRDHDGVVDRFDKCPDEPGSLRHEGCPSMDSDGDGVADAEDKCPQTKGVFENEGCPVVSDSEKEVLALAIQNLYFPTDKSDIDRQSYSYLNKLAELLVKQDDWNLRLKGHADSRASSEYNLALSKRRAEAVMFYLQNRGVKRNQLMVEYYGEAAPTANNASEGGRQLNRRVEMEFIFH